MIDIEKLFHREDPPQIMMGSVGWEDEDDYYFPGDGDDDGHTLVRVQLFEGRDHTKPLNPNRAQGHKIVCHLSSLAGRRVPPKDSRVYVAVPRDMENVPGAGVIFAAIEKTPARAGNLDVDETVIVGPEGSAGRVIIKKNGTVAMMTEVEGNSITLSLSPDGLKFNSPYGNFVFDITGFHLRTKAGPRIDMGAIVVPGLPAEVAEAVSSYCKITAGNVKLDGAVVYLGSGSTYNPIMHAPSTALSAPIPTFPVAAAPGFATVQAINLSSAVRVATSTSV